MSVTVVIAFPEQLSALAERPDLGEVLPFADTELPRAFDVIKERRPRTVVLEQMFAATSQGAALIDRIKCESALQSCEIRIVALGDGYGGAPLDMSGTRRAPRFPVIDGTGVEIDGKPATLVNLSLVGAQVVSPTSLKPNQRVRFGFPDEGRPIRIHSVVASVAVEIVNGVPRYRAGIEFFNADQTQVQRLIDSKRKR